MSAVLISCGAQQYKSLIPMIESLRFSFGGAWRSFLQTIVGP
jgi:hypothetical protein